MNWELAGEIASAVLIVSGTMFMILRHIKERKARKTHGLPGNPTRCVEADKRIVALEICSAETKVRLEAIDNKLDNVASDVKDLIKLHVKP